MGLWLRADDPAWNMSALPKVIVVDDTEDHASVMAIGLRFEGFEVETAQNAAEALHMMAGGTFDLAMVDLMMPGTNGIELARMIRDQFPHTRVVLMSAYPLSRRQIVLSDCGAVGFVPTPFDLTELACFLRGKLATVEPGDVVTG
jgi:DNA-binding response OmpR family regulator